MNCFVICTTGRSGSTLLQGLLNSCDQCIVRGENNNMLFGLFKSYRSIFEVQEKYAGKTTASTHPWFGAEHMSATQFITDARSLVFNQLCAPMNVKNVGFKEIRWDRSYLGDVSLQDYLEFIIELLPNLKFVFLTRDPKEVIVSQERAEFEIGAGRARRIYIIHEFYDAMRSAMRSGLPIFEIDYRDLTEHSTKLSDMFNFLELKSDLDRLKTALSTPHSYANSRSEF